MWLADVVRLLHVLLVCFMLWAPVFGDRPMLVLASAMYLSLFLHWVTNNDTCALTLLEQHLRGVQKQSTFMQSLVGPVFQVNGSALGNMVWVISIIFFAIGLWRLRPDRVWQEIRRQKNV